jgi:hypothetical protein
LRRLDTGRRGDPIHGLYEEIDALAHYVDITINALKRSLMAREQEQSKTES